MSAFSPQTAPGATVALPDASLPELPGLVPRTLRALAQEGPREARIRLRPPELGSIHVLVRVEGTRVDAHIAAERAPVRALLDRMRNELGRSLKDSGLDLALLRIDALPPAAERAEGAFSRASMPPDPGASAPAPGSLAGAHSSPSSAGERQQGQAPPDSALRLVRAASGAEAKAPGPVAPRTAGRVDAWA